jgi:hypothetical protein
MRRIRFSIASLLGLVLFVAAVAAALREANDIWDSGMFTLAVSLLLASVLLALHLSVLMATHRTGRRRTAWTGFALFGWAYHVASLMSALIWEIVANT